MEFGVMVGRLIPLKVFVFLYLYKFILLLYYFEKKGQIKRICHT